ncbi:phenylacetate--CoA ligase family protein [Clostridium butyricum]|uniref:phenylacetate--CoA ligase family protein n=1 Tax=Clostridium butyricum TaxID=1492 RepID=UPI002AB1DC58|nr:hypothetical protein [Clostridium butyricum]
MKDFEYKNLWEKGQREFLTFDHNSVLEKKIESSLNEIIHFSEKSQEEIKAYQLKKLSELVDYAYLNIPLYREKYSKVDYKVGDIKTFEDFEKLPLLYKEELIEGFPDKIVTDVENFKYSTRSSGSSAKFVTLAIDFDSIYTDTLQGIRQFIRQSDFKYKKEDRVLFIYTCPWWIKDINGNYIQDFLPTTTDVSVALEHIKETRPLIISTYPTYLQKFCELDVKLSDYGVKYAIVHSEQSNPKTRNAMAKELGVKVVDEYSSEELTRIALECSEGYYHIEEDACYIEVLDRETKKKVDNGTGIVVGTNLINKATPIIRYWQNDLVTIDSTKKCSCGSHGRIITQVQGREMDCILSDGQKIPASAFMDLAYNWFLKNRIPVMGMKYQFHQTAENELKVYLQKGIYDLMGKDLETIKESIYQLVSRTMKVNIVFTDKFVKKTTKFKPVLREQFN